MTSHGRGAQGYFTHLIVYSIKKKSVNIMIVSITVSFSRCFSLFDQEELTTVTRIDPVSTAQGS